MACDSRKSSVALKRPDLTVWLGRRVTVTVDRPLGSRHPDHPVIVYPVNYGYLPGATGGDGHAIDAYVLGIAAAVPAACGVVAAVVQRADDVEDKLVVAPAGRRVSAEEIACLLHFQEQFFVSTILCWHDDHDDERSPCAR